MYFLLVSSSSAKAEGRVPSEKRVRNFNMRPDRWLVKLYTGV